MFRTIQRIGLVIGLTLLAGGAAMSLTACHTVEGVGQDVSAAGQTVADWASDTNPEK